MRKKVLLVDDHPAMLWALKNMLAQQVHFEIIGEAVDGDGCLEFVRENETDLIILDIDMPKVDGFDVIRRLKIISPDSRILVVSSLEAKVYGSRVRSNWWAWLYQQNSELRHHPSRLPSSISRLYIFSCQ